MENNNVQFIRPPIKHDERYVQRFTIDGCTVRVNFLPENTQDNNKPTLENIRKTLIASAYTK